MIHLDRKTYFKNIVFTLFLYNLKFVGLFEFIVLEKAIIKLHNSDATNFCLYLSTKDGQYSSTVIVSEKNYNKAVCNKDYGVCSVIKNVKHDDFILISENTNPDTVIRQIVLKSWCKMIFILFVLALCCIFPLIILFWLL